MRSIRRAGIALLLSIFAVGTGFSLFFWGRSISFPRPCRAIVERSGVEPALVYAIIKAESGFREDATSRAGAIGLMQLRPATAAFVCSREGIVFEPHRLTEGGYNVVLGTAYLRYLFDRFPVLETALAAYNAGEGTVSGWLNEGACSEDGQTLSRIPYAETAVYVKKVKNFYRIYRFCYR